MKLVTQKGDLPRFIAKSSIWVTRAETPGRIMRLMTTTCYRALEALSP